MESNEKLLLVRNRLREEAFSLNRRVKDKLFMNKVHPEWCSPSEVEEVRERCKKAFKKWKAIEGRLKDETKSSGNKEDYRQIEISA